MRVTVKEPHPFPSLCLLAKNRFLSLPLPQCLTDVFLQCSRSKQLLCLQLNLTRSDKRHWAACWGWSMKNLFAVLDCRLSYQVTEIQGLSIRKGELRKTFLLSSMYIHVVTSPEVNVLPIQLENCQSTGPLPLSFIKDCWKGCLKTFCRASWCSQDYSFDSDDQINFHPADQNFQLFS